MSELEPQFYNAGYFLIEGVKRAAHMSAEILPEMIYSVSTCLGDLHPPMEMLSWMTKEGFSPEKYQQRLGLSDEAFLEVITKVDQFFEVQTFGFNSVFFQENTAQEFAKTYLHKLENLKLFQAIVPVQLAEQILAESQTEAYTPDGLDTVISKKEIVETDSSTLLGYEVIVYDFGSCCSFICNGLEKSFQNDLGIKINPKGYIPSLNEAIKAADYCNLESTGAEPGYWFPVGMREIPLSMVSK